MPELFRVFGLVFFFYSKEHLPIHVHVRNSDGRAKFLLEPEISLLENKGMKNKDLKQAKELIIENKDLIIKRWKEFHKTL